MSINLTSNFLQNARGLTFEDGGGIAWAFNSNTNQISAAYSGAGSAGAANPTAKVGLTAVNGSAATFMRSDGAPPIDQGITPTWTGKHTFSYSGSVIADDAGTAQVLGFREFPVNTFANGYVLALSDRHKFLTPATSAAVLTTPSDAEVAFPVGTIVLVCSGGLAMSIVAGTGANLYWADGSGTAKTGTRNIAAFSMCWLLKQGSNTWFIWGSGIS